MERSLSRKCSGGKLVKVSIRSEDGVIAEARITGDFFTHPEGVIERLEGRLVGLKAGQVSGTVSEELGRGALTIGFNARELILMIEECLS